MTPTPETEERIIGEWYWVSNDGKTWWPAKWGTEDYMPPAWHNNDTWEDWDGQVRFWRHIPAPASESRLCANGEWYTCGAGVLLAIVGVVICLVLR